VIQRKPLGVENNSLSESVDGRNPNGGDRGRGPVQPLSIRAETGVASGLSEATATK